MDQNILTLKDVTKSLASYALGGAKIPHGISNPVFRKLEDGTFVIAAFVFTFTKEMLSQNKANAPCEWILINPHDGSLIARYECTNKPFSQESDSAVDLLPETNAKFSGEYKYYSISIFETILKKYVQKGVFDNELNEAYMYLMLNPISKGLKKYYRDLNNV